MTTKQVTISARISHEDAEFISRLEIPGAKTPSDKLRKIITEARNRTELRGDYGGTLQLINELIMPVIQSIRKTELDIHSHSEVLVRLAEWIPDVVAFLVSFNHEPKKEKIKESMNLLEQGATERLFRLIESVLQLAVTGRSSCYDPHIINRHIEPVLDLCHIIAERSQEKGKEK